MAAPYDVYLDSAKVPPDGAYDVRLYPDGAHSDGPTIAYRTGGIVSIGHVAGLHQADARTAGGQHAGGQLGGSVAGVGRVAGVLVSDAVLTVTLSADTRAGGGPVSSWAGSGSATASDTSAPTVRFFLTPTLRPSRHRARLR